MDMDQGMFQDNQNLLPMVTTFNIFFSPSLQWGAGGTSCIYKGIVTWEVWLFGGGVMYAKTQTLRADLTKISRRAGVRFSTAVTPRVQIFLEQLLLELKIHNLQLSDNSLWRDHRHSLE